MPSYDLPLPLIPIGTGVAMPHREYRCEGLAMFGLGILGTILLIVLILWLLGVIG